MKSFALIMAVIVLMQSWMPCNDAVFAKKDVKAQTEISQATQQNDTEHEDACSPFCQCACCAGFSLNHTLTTVPAPSISFNKEFAAYLPANPVEVSLPVWQPPKLAA